MPSHVVYYDHCWVELYPIDPFFFFYFLNARETLRLENIMYRVVLISLTVEMNQKSVDFGKFNGFIFSLGFPGG